MGGTQLIEVKKVESLILRRIDFLEKKSDNILLEGLEYRDDWANRELESASIDNLRDYGQNIVAVSELKGLYNQIKREL